MEPKNDITNRFLKAYTYLIDTQQVADKKDFATKIGISASMVTELSKGRSAVGTKAIQNIVVAFKINPQWLLTGEGPMLKEPQSAALPTPPLVAHGEHTDEPGIPLIPLNAMAGALSGTDTQIMPYDCESYNIPAFKGADFLIHVKGDSMEPTFRSGDIVACRRVALSNIFFQWNKVYVLDTDQGPLIKRIRRAADNDHILIVSDNQEYEPFELHLSQLHAICLVVGMIRPE